MATEKDYSPLTHDEKLAVAAAQSAAHVIAAFASKDGTNFDALRGKYVEMMQTAYGFLKSPSPPK